MAEIRKGKQSEFVDALGDLFAYDKWPSRSEWGTGAARGINPFDTLDYHVDLGCGTLPKARIAVDRYPAPGVNVLHDLNSGYTFALPGEPGGDSGSGADSLLELNVEGGLMHGLPFVDNGVESIISHHTFEHIGDGFLPMMTEIHRVLKPGGILRIIVPVFPSWSAVSDPDHRRMFMCDHTSEDYPSTFDSFFVDDAGNSWLESFSVPYIGTAKFQRLAIDVSPPVPPEFQWTTRDSREMRIAMSAWKG